MTSNRFFLRPVIVGLFSLLSTLAQMSGSEPGPTGRIVGQVSNKATGDFLSSAFVGIAGTNITAITDRAGAFSLVAPAGNQTLMVEFSGLDSAAIPVLVLAGQIIRRDAALTSQVYAMDTFVVKGVREGSALAIQQEREAMNVKTVVATDTFGNPAANPGELLQRMPDVTVDVVGSQVRTVYIRGMFPQFASLMVDGNRMASSNGGDAGRQFQIEQQGTGDIESVEVIKAPTPDMDANAIAGYINLITKRAFDLPGRRLSVSVATSAKDRGDVSGATPFKEKFGGLDLAAVSYSDTYSVGGGKDNLGIAVNFNRVQLETTEDEDGPGGLTFGFGDWNFNPAGQPVMVNFGWGEFGHASVVQNGGLNISYKPNDNTSIYVNSIFNSNTQHQTYYRTQIGADYGAPPMTPDSTTAFETITSTTMSSYSSVFPKKSKNYTFAAGSESKLFDGDVNLSFSGNYSHADIDYPGWVQVTSTVPGVGFSLDRRNSDPWYPKFTQVSGPSIYNAANYTPQSYFNSPRHAPDTIKGLKADLRKDFHGKFASYLKIGVKFDLDNRAQYRSYQYYTYAGPQGMGQYLGYQYPQAASHYGPIPYLAAPDTGKANDILTAPAGTWIQTPANAYTGAFNSLASNAQYQEKIAAAYVMGNVNFGKLRLLAGVRFEETNTSGTGYVIDKTIANTTFDPTLSNAQNIARAQAVFSKGTTTQGGKYGGTYPGIHLVYEPEPGLIIRSSYNASIARPEVANLLPILNVNPNNANTSSISIGNPNLKPYRSDNYEFSIQKYFEPVGLLEVGVFVKDITDFNQSVHSFIPAGSDNGFNGQYAGDPLTTFANVGSAHISGVDFSYQQQYSFLPGLFKGLGSFANFTSETAKANGGPIGGFTPHSGNAGLSYVFHGFQGRVLANYRSKTFLWNDGILDIWQHSNTFIDVKLQYTIARNYDIFLDVVNLFDAPTTAFILANGQDYFKFNQGTLFTAGVRARF